MKKLPARFRHCACAIAAVAAPLLLTPHTAGAGGEPALPHGPPSGELTMQLPVPYTARYSVVKSGATVAEAVYTLTRSPQGWEFHAHARPAKMISFFVSTEIDEYSLFEIDGVSVRPLRYRYKQAADEAQKDKILQADYDWQSATVTVTDGVTNRRLELSPAAHDPLSVQLAVIQCMKKDCGHMDFLVLDDLELEKRHFEHGGAESIRTALGNHETVKVSHRSGKRETVTWLAPGLNHIPVMIRQYRNGKLKSEMRITAVDFE